MKHLIINVDDLGLSHQVNQAVVDLAHKKRISSTSYMVGGAISNEHKQALQDLKIDVGLHLDFTGIFPSPLTGSLKQILFKSYTYQFNKELMAKNVKQQFDDFEAVFNHAPIFVDGHQHIHQFPIIRDVLINEMKRREVNFSRTTKPLIKDLKSWIIYSLGGRVWENLCQKNKISNNTGFAGVYGFDQNIEGLKALWQTWLSACPDESHNNKNITSLIMCHPATPVQSGEPEYQDDIKRAREIEYHWLMSDDFGHLITNNIQLNHW